MVIIKLFFEGGADPNSNPNAETMDNTNKLRESFNQLFNSAFESEITQIEAAPIYSAHNIKNIKPQLINNISTVLLIDLDAPKTEKHQRIKDSDLIEIQERVFFMIQRMESWILSQPVKIEECFWNFKKSDILIQEDNQIKNKNPEEISNPEKVLTIILQRYFEYEKAGKIKKLKYGKLKTAPDLIEFLDINQLRKDFDEVESLIIKVTEIAMQQ
jgi:hypothetical protein